MSATDIVVVHPDTLRRGEPLPPYFDRRETDGDDGRDRRFGGPNACVPLDR